MVLPFFIKKYSGAVAKSLAVTYILDNYLD